jgi:hypothetical protein
MSRRRRLLFALVVLGLGCGAANGVPGTYRAEVTRTPASGAGGAVSSETVVLAQDARAFSLTRGDCTVKGGWQGGYDFAFDPGQSCAIAGERRKLVSGSMTAQSGTRATLVWSLEDAPAERFEETMVLTKTGGCR